MYLMYPVPDQDWGGQESEVKGVRQYRVTQTDLDSFIVEIVPDDGYTDGNFSYVAKNFRRFLHEDVAVTLRLVDDIAPTASGKRRYVRSQLEERPSGRQTTRE
jgi:hypothetical protein